MKIFHFERSSNACINKKCLGALSSVIQCTASAYLSKMLMPWDTKP